MNTKAIIVSVLFSIFLSTIITAQKITGKIADKDEAIPFANITITNNQHKIISGTTSDDFGHFEINIPKGKYTITVSYVGFENWKKEIIVLESINLSTIILKENNQALEEIIIKTEKRIIEREIDRLVFNVEKSIAATGGTGLDILRITPGVQIQNGIIEILGKGATQIMINGRISPLVGEDLASFLSGFSANDIQKIEVITSPPAKYDAAGNGGLINIILKKGVQDSWRNAATVSYNQNRYNFTNFNNNFFLNKGKVSLSASVNATKGSLENLEGILIEYPNNFWDINVDSEIIRDQFSGRFLIDYAASENTVFGIQYLGNATAPNIMGTTTSSIFDNNHNLEKKLVNRGDNIADHKNHTINFHVITKLDSLGKNIAFDVDYFTFDSDNSRDFYTEEFNAANISQGITSSALNIANQAIENYSAKIDVEHPFKKIKLSYGIKASFTATKSDVLYYNTLSGNHVLDANKSNQFNYKEDVLAAYFSGNTTITKQLKMQFGLRLEDTKTKGVNAEINQENNNKYTKLFPSLYFSYAKNEQNTFGFAYGRRINRPNFRNLNPFRFYINDNSYSVGNPFLQPSFSDNFEFSHQYKNNLNTSISVNSTTDGFGVFFNTDAQNQDQIITRENYFRQYTFKFEESFSYNKISWWQSQNSLNLFGFVTKFTKDFGTNPKNGMQLFVSSNNTFSLSDVTKLQVNSFYSSQHNRGLFSVGEMFDLSFGLQHQFKNNIKISLQFNDVLNTASLKDYISNVNGIEQNYRQNESSRNFRFSLSYDFGNKKITVKDRSFGNDEERRRSN